MWYVVWDGFCAEINVLTSLICLEIARAHNSPSLLFSFLAYDETRQVFARASLFGVAHTLRVQRRSSGVHRPQFRMQPSLVHLHLTPCEGAAAGSGGNASEIFAGPIFHSFVRN